MARLTFLLFLLWVGVGMSRMVDLQKRIIGGKDCESDNRHYHVKLIDGKGELICGASLISDEWILTAAHCYEPGQTMYAVLGVHPGPGEKVKIKAPPEIYTDIGKNNNKRSHDIMLLKLPKATKIQPIALSCSHPLKNEPVEIAGHGATTGGLNNEHINDESPTLQCAHIDIVDCNAYSNNLKSADPDLHNKMSYQHWLCGQKSGVDICYGDSGGGVVYDNKIYGVLSFSGLKICTEPVAFMNICNQEYLKWIKDTIK